MDINKVLDNIKVQWDNKKVEAESGVRDFSVALQALEEIRKHLITEEQRCLTEKSPPTISYDSESLTEVMDLPPQPKKSRSRKRKE